MESGARKGDKYRGLYYSVKRDNCLDAWNIVIGVIKCVGSTGSNDCHMRRQVELCTWTMSITVPP